MSLNNYLNENEKILYQWELGSKGGIGPESEKKIKVNVLGITNKRVFHFKKLKGYDRIYRDVPLAKVSYIENAWHARNLILLSLGAILFVIGLSLAFTSIFTLIIGLLLLVIGIILVIKGLKQYGYIMINGEDWKFTFSKREDIKTIEEFIREIYFIIIE